MAQSSLSCADVPLSNYSLTFAFKTQNETRGIRKAILYVGQTRNRILRIVGRNDVTMTSPAGARLRQWLRRGVDECTARIQHSTRLREQTADCRVNTRMTMWGQHA